jgi:hypothetical protein
MGKRVMRITPGLGQFLDFGIGEGHRRARSLLAFLRYKVLAPIHAEGGRVEANPQQNGSASQTRLKWLDIKNGCWQLKRDLFAAKALDDGRYDLCSRTSAWETTNRITLNGIEEHELFDIVKLYAKRISELHLRHSQGGV